MSKRRAAERGKQASNDPQALPAVMRQMVLPLIVGAEATKRGLLAFVQQMGMLALRELFDGEAEMIAGPKGKHVESRTHHHWGTTRTPLPFGGRHVVVERPRVRRKGGGEEMLPSVEAFRASDPITARVAEQIVLGVSTRGYAPSLGAISEELEGPSENLCFLTSSGRPSTRKGSPDVCFQRSCYQRGTARRAAGLRVLL